MHPRVESSPSGHPYPDGCKCNRSGNPRAGIAVWSKLKNTDEGYKTHLMIIGSHIYFRLSCVLDCIRILLRVVEFCAAGVKVGGGGGGRKLIE